MKRYLVTWTLVKWGRTSCTCDLEKYGISSHDCIVLHEKNTEETMSRDFETLQEAEEFVKNAPLFFSHSLVKERVRGFSIRKEVAV